MRISTYNDLGFVQFDRRDEDGFVIFDVSAGMAEFTGRNQGIILLDVPEFLKRLAEFEVTRLGKVTLEGSEDFSFWVEAFDRAGHVGIGFRLRRYVYTGCKKALPLTFEGGFEFDAGSTLELVRNFRELLRGEHWNSVV